MAKESTYIVLWPLGSWFGSKWPPDVLLPHCRHWVLCQETNWERKNITIQTYACFCCSLCIASASIPPGTYRKHEDIVRVCHWVGQGRTFPYWFCIWAMRAARSWANSLSSYTTAELAFHMTRIPGNSLRAYHDPRLQSSTRESSPSWGMTQCMFHSLPVVFCSGSFVPITSRPFGLNDLLSFKPIPFASNFHRMCHTIAVARWRQQARQNKQFFHWLSQCLYHRIRESELLSAASTTMYVFACIHLQC